MSNPFILKLAGFSPLSVDQRYAIETLITHPVSVGAHENVVRADDEPQSVHVVMSGWACRYKVLPDERRQILSLFLPGDICDPYVFLLGAVDFAIGTLTPCSIAKVPAQAVRHVAAYNPVLAEALWWQTLVASEVQREWTLSLGRRTALERVAHLFCEVLARLKAVDLSNGTACEWPITQNDLADATGLSTVHVSRSIGELRAAGLVDLRSRRLVVHDQRQLMGLAMFDPGYLHQRPR